VRPQLDFRLRGDGKLGDLSRTLRPQGPATAAGLAWPFH